MEYTGHFRWPFFFALADVQFKVLNLALSNFFPEAQGALHQNFNSLLNDQICGNGDSSAIIRPHKKIETTNVLNDTGPIKVFVQNTYAIAQSQS